MRIGDWSSDVCSSDLERNGKAAFIAVPAGRPAPMAGMELERVSLGEVRLRTMEAGASAPRANPQLTTRIVTVAETQARPELMAPIITVGTSDAKAPPAFAAGEEIGRAHV